MSEREISLEELEQHNETSDTQWVCIDGYVCDVTKYKDDHPGIHYKFHHKYILK